MSRRDAKLLSLLIRHVIVALREKEKARVLAQRRKGAKNNDKEREEFHISPRLSASARAILFICKIWRRQRSTSKARSALVRPRRTSLRSCASGGYPWIVLFFLPCSARCSAFPRLACSDLSKPILRRSPTRPIRRRAKGAGDCSIPSPTKTSPSSPSSHPTLQTPAISLRSKRVFLRAKSLSANRAPRVWRAAATAAYGRRTTPEPASTSSCSSTAASARCFSSQEN